MCADLDLPTLCAQDIARQIRAQVGAFMPPEQSGTGLACSPLRRVCLDLWHKGVHLTDQFDWDISRSSSPHTFARQLVSDLGLGHGNPVDQGIWVRLVTFQIHRQLSQTQILAVSQPRPAYPGTPAPGTDHAALAQSDKTGRGQGTGAHLGQGLGGPSVSLASEWHHIAPE
ncbi:transcription regulatory protein SNF5 [Kipferlia bialata]|uniref:Transcription regulatory protein SNF5 n=1 Tax=Kipferlia bialata TaxID=797122 RepID=A0A9K3CYE0_9EUKA|nr:transcription regulatory protein SNF5 [Kipferlia bialata]|eukprot:g7331.t1